MSFPRWLTRKVIVLVVSVVVVCFIIGFVVNRFWFRPVNQTETITKTTTISSGAVPTPTTAPATTQAAEKPVVVTPKPEIDPDEEQVTRIPIRWSVKFETGVVTTQPAQ